MQNENSFTDLFRIDDPSYVEEIARKEYTCGSFEVSFEKQRLLCVRELRKQWMGCMNCGCRQQIYYVHGTSSEPLGALACSVKCAEILRTRRWKTVHDGSVPWPVQLKCCLANQIVLGSPIPRTETANSTTRNEKIADNLDEGNGVLVRTYTHLFSAIDKLQRQLAQVKRDSVDPIEKRLVAWISSFESWIEGAGKMNGAEFRMQLGLQINLLADIPAGKTAEDIRRTLESIQSISPATVDTYTDKQNELQPSRNILSLDGGGMRGIITAIVLAAMQEEIRRQTGNRHAKLQDYFDLVIGTSTGSILAGGIFLLDMTTHQIREYYRKFGSEIFSTRNEIVSSSVDPLRPMIVKYHDLPVSKFFLDETRNLRLDEKPCAFDEKGPRKVRVAFTSVEISTGKPRLVLFRNYKLETNGPSGTTDNNNDNKTLDGTNEAFVWEAMRCSTSALSYFHPYSREYALMYRNPDTGRSEYAQSKLDDVNGTYKRYTNRQFILDHITKEGHKGETLRKKVIHGDKFLNSSTVMLDGGVMANNPALMACVEAGDIWRDERTANLISIGTGDPPATPNNIWNPQKNPAPMDLGYFGRQNILGAFKELLNKALVYTAAETADTEFVLSSIQPSLASYFRINVPLDRPIEMSMHDAETIRYLTDVAEQWVHSVDGSTLIRNAVSKIIVGRK